MQKACFGAGCFWGVEDAYRQIKGVISTCVGYAGGETEDPSYAEVCAGETGHTEAVEIEYDPSQVAYEDLLNLFWENHDPTLNMSRQYRSVIICYEDEQTRAARKSMDRLIKSGKYAREIRTEILSASKFYRAEEYHQQYYEKQREAAAKLNETRIKN